jgi:hypothetical protein
MSLRRGRAAGAGAAAQSANPATQQPGPVGEQPGAVAGRTTRTIVVAALLAGVLASGMLVWGSSSAMFAGTTSTPTNSWAAGAVSLSDDDSSTAMFTTATSIVPGDSGTECIKVTFTGNMNANVRLYASLGGTGLGTYIDLVIDQGNGGDSSTCSGFVMETSTGTLTMAAFAAARTNYATGFGTWAPTANLQTRTYRVAWSIQSNNSAVGKTATLALTWEAQG